MYVKVLQWIWMEIYTRLSACGFQIWLMVRLTLRGFHFRKTGTFSRLQRTRQEKQKVNRNETKVWTMLIIWTKRVLSDLHTNGNRLDFILHQDKPWERPTTVPGKSVFLFLKIPHSQIFCWKLFMSQSRRVFSLSNKVLSGKLGTQGHVV